MPPPNVQAELIRTLADTLELPNCPSLTRTRALLFRVGGLDTVQGMTVEPEILTAASHAIMRVERLRVWTVDRESNSPTTALPLAPFVEEFERALLLLLGAGVESARVVSE